MAKLKAEIKGIDSLLLKLNEVKKVHLVDSVRKATVLVHGQAVSSAPANDGGLRGSIRMDYKEFTDKVQGRVYTNLEYAPYVEFGTGIKGDGTYPYKIKGVNLTYASSPWFIPSSEISKKTAEKYHFKKIHGKDGNLYYMTYGQAAQPFMYPAIKNNRKQIETILMNGIRESLKKTCKGGK